MTDRAEELYHEFLEGNRREMDGGHKHLMIAAIQKMEEEKDNVIFQLNEDIDRITREREDYSYQCQRNSNEIEQLKNDLRRVKSELEGKQYELDREVRKRKEVEDTLHRRRMGFGH